MNLPSSKESVLKKKKTNWTAVSMYMLLNHTRTIVDKTAIISTFGGDYGRSVSWSFQDAAQHFIN